MTAPPGSVVIDPAQLEAIVARVVSSNAEPTGFWPSLVREWTKPVGLVTLASCLGFGFALFLQIRSNTETNANQDAYLERVVKPAVEQLSRLETRQTQAEEKQREFMLAQKDLTASWSEWRKVVDEKLTEARDTTREVGALKGKAEAQDNRSSRIFDTLSAQITALAASINQIERSVAVLTDRVGGRRTSAPFEPARPNRTVRAVKTKAPQVRVAVRKIKRPRAATVGLFSARPFYRGPYLGSLQRHGMIR